ncbi:MAG: hypothetical protein BIFFINMI_03931 [Phycisphaerae bacterium]|nr:hypothetical protein [Phycisphaerae bacterium]
MFTRPKPAVRAILVSLSAALLLALTARGLFGEDLPRSVQEEFTLDSSGNAEFTRVESLSRSPLGKLYVEHAKAVESDKKVSENLLSEATRYYQQLYNIKPKLKLDEQTVGDETLTRRIKGEFRRLARTDPDDKKVRMISVRQFPDEKSDEKRLLAYFEGVLDSRMLESAMLSAFDGKQTLKGNASAVYHLPAGAKIENLKELADRSWKVDFGGGNLIEGSLKVDEKAGTVTYAETVTVTEEKPDKLLVEKNEKVFEDLRACGSFIIRYSQPQAQADPAEPGESLAAADCYEGGLDFSGTWSTTFSHTLTKSFTHQTLAVTPSVILSLNLGATLTWEHQWVKVSWWKWQYKLKKFEAKLTVTPGADASIAVSSGAALSKDWSADIITKNTTLSFSVVCVPVWIVLEAKLKVGAEATVSGVIAVSGGAKATVTNNLSVKYENGGWSKSSSFSKSLQFNSLTANAQVEATATASAPFRVSAYIYYIAGPYAEVKPWVKAHTKAQAGNATGVSYDITTGIDLNGGAAMAGWLKSLCDNLPSYDTTFATVGPFTIASGNKTISP